MSKTNLDLHFSAATAAMHTMEVTNEYDAEVQAMAIFKQEEQDKNDWVFWRNQFLDRRAAYRQLKGQTPQSIIIAQRSQARILLPPKPATPPPPNPGPAPTAPGIKPGAPPTPPPPPAVSAT